MTGEKQWYTSTPEEAVIAAYARQQNDGNTWQWRDRYGHLVIKGKHTVSCGDWITRKEQGQ